MALTLPSGSQVDYAPGHTADHNLIVAALNELDARTITTPLRAPSVQPSMRTSVISVVSNGWTNQASSFASVNTAHADTVFGTTSLQCVTKGDGATIGKVATFGRTAITTVNKYLAVLMKVDEVTNLNYVKLYFGGSAFGWYELLNTAYGGVIGTASIRSNEWQWVIFGRQSEATSGTLAPATTTDWQVAVLDTGVAVTINIGAIATVDQPTAYPNGVVSFTFDDALASQWTYARPVFAERSLRATEFVIVDAVGAGGLTETQCDSLYDLGWDLAGHAYTTAAHNAVGGLLSLSSAQQADQMQQMKKWLLDRGYARGANIFAYPQGRHDTTLAGNTRDYFSIARTTMSSPNQPVAIDDPTNIRCYYIHASTTLAQAKTQIDNAKTNKHWLVFVFHGIVSASPTGDEWTQADLAALVDYAVAQAVPVQPMSQVQAAITPA